MTMAKAPNVVKPVSYTHLAGRNAGMTVCAVDDAFSASDEKEKKEKADYFIRSYDEIQAKTYERCGV